MEKEYLDFDEAVVFLKTTPSTLYKWLQAGKIPGHKLGRQWRFLREELEIQVSGKGSKINIQRDFLALSELLLSRSINKEKQMDQHFGNLHDQLIWDAFEHGSRLIHIYPAKGKFEISYRTKNGLEKLTSFQEESFAEIDSALMKNSIEAADGLSRRIYLHRGEDNVLQVKYQKIETVSGPRVTLRLYHPEKDVLPLERITGDKNVLNTFKNWTKKSHGIILVSGAIGSGKTTTVYSLLNEYINQGRVVFTIEDSAELIIDKLNQIEIKGKAASQFEQTFDRVYSSDPDVICLGLGSNLGVEEKVFGAAYKAASTGHLVVVQMDQPSCKEAIETFKKFVNYPVDSFIIGVSCQKLVAQEGKIKAQYDFLNT